MCEIATVVVELKMTQIPSRLEYCIYMFVVSDFAVSILPANGKHELIQAAAFLRLSGSNELAILNTGRSDLTTI